MGEFQKVIKYARQVKYFTNEINSLVIKIPKKEKKCKYLHNIQIKIFMSVYFMLFQYF